MKTTRHVLIDNFWNVGSNGDTSLAKEDLGWSDMIKRDAQSDYPETIFRYIVEVVGLNILVLLAERQELVHHRNRKGPH